MTASLWFVTPAFRRYQVSEVCFAHRAWCIAELRAAGIDAHCVVVADDENLELAREHGFETRERANDFLGARWNDGYEHAAHAGADFVCPIGSDSWIHPSFFFDLPDPREHVFLTSRYYAICDERGRKLAKLEIAKAGGVGPNVIPTRMLGRVRHRPVVEELQRGCDGSLMRSIKPQRPESRWSDEHPLQYFAFRVHGEQLNPYELLARKYAVSVTRNVWSELSQIHPERFVAAGQRIYAGRLAAVA